MARQFRLLSCLYESLLWLYLESTRYVYGCLYVYAFSVEWTTIHAVMCPTISCLKLDVQLQRCTQVSFYLVTCLSIRFKNAKLQNSKKGEGAKDKEIKQERKEFTEKDIEIKKEEKEREREESVSKTHNKQLRHKTWILRSRFRFQQGFDMFACSIC